MCGRDRVFFRSSSDLHHHPCASLRAIQQSLSARSEAGSSDVWKQFLPLTDARDAFESGTQQLRDRVTLIRVYYISIETARINLQHDWCSILFRC